MRLFGRNCIVLSYALSLTMLLALASCGHSDDAEDDWAEELEKVKDPEFPSDPASGTLSSTEVKKRLDKAAIDLLDQINASDFNYIKNLSKHVSTVLVDYEAEDAMATRVSEMIERVLVDEVSETVFNEYETYTHYHTTSKYTWLYRLTNCSGHYSAKNDKWEYAEAKDFAVFFEDQEGMACTLTLEVSQDTVQIHVSDDSYEDYTRLHSSNGKDAVFDSEHETHHLIAVPRIIRLVLKQQNRVRLEMVVKNELGTSQDGERVMNHLKKLTALTRIDDYQFGFTKGYYNLCDKVEFNWVLRKNDQMLLDLYALLEVKEDEIEYHQCKLSLNVMNQAQIYGEVQNVNRFVDYLSVIRENTHSEQIVKENQAAADALLDLSLYFDNDNKVRQADVVLMAEAEDNGCNGIVWHVNPVVAFGDGLSYSCFGEFFDNGFEALVVKFRQVVKDFDFLIEQ